MNLCGDNSCLFGKPEGVGTNGGCRCLRDLSPGCRAKVTREIRTLQAENKRLRQICADASRMLTMLIVARHIVDPFVAQTIADTREVLREAVK